MDEYYRILIERYCSAHSRSKKSAFLSELVEGSYDLSYCPGDAEAIQLEKYIEQEKDPALKEALQELDEYLFL